MLPKKEAESEVCGERRIQRLAKYSLYPKCGAWGVQFAETEWDEHVNSDSRVSDELQIQCA